MPIRLRCDCGNTLKVPSSLAGKKIRCPRCNTVLKVPAESYGLEADEQDEATEVVKPRKRRPSVDAEPEPAPAPPRFSQADPDLRLPLLWSLGWVVLGFNLALLVPWLGFCPDGLLWCLNHLAPLITVGMIGWNVVESFRLVRRTGETLAALPLTVLQVVLFALLFFQICCHLGAANYSWKETPQWWDWLGFVGCHALRAADLIDALDAYGLSAGFQSIHHNSLIAALALIGYHLVLDLFLISLIVQWAQPLKDKLASRSDARSRGRRLMGFLLLFFLVWLVSALIIRPWRFLDILLWPIDNVLRILDFTGAMQIFHLRLHRVPNAGWEGTLTLIFRLLIAAFLVGILTSQSRRFRLRWLGGFGLSPMELEALTNDGEPLVRQLADERLAYLSWAARQEKKSWFRLGPLSGTAYAVGGIYAVLLLLGIVFCANWQPPLKNLIAAATQAPEGSAQAQAALRRMGSFAEAGIPDLVAAVPRFPRDQQLTLLQTLGYLGKGAQPTLRAVLESADEEFALGAVHALAQNGPQVASLLVRGLTSPHESVRRATRSAFVALGSPVVQALVDQVSEETFAQTYELLEQVDPYWDLARSRNRLYKSLLEVRSCMRLLDDPGAVHRYRLGLNLLADLKELGAPAIPFFLQQLKTAQAEQAEKTLQAIAKMRKAGVPVLLKIMDDSPHRLAALQILSIPYVDADANWDDNVLAHMVVSGLLKKLIQASPKPIALANGKTWQKELGDTLQRLLAKEKTGYLLEKELLVMLADKNDQVRYYAAWSVGQLGGAGVNLYAPLRRLVNDPRPEIRAAAQEALDRKFPGWREQPAPK